MFIICFSIFLLFYYFCHKNLHIFALPSSAVLKPAQAGLVLICLLYLIPYKNVSISGPNPNLPVLLLLYFTSLACFTCLTCTQCKEPLLVLKRLFYFLTFCSPLLWTSLFWYSRGLLFFLSEKILETIHFTSAFYRFQPNC